MTDGTYRTAAPYQQQVLSSFNKILYLSHRLFIVSTTSSVYQFGTEPIAYCIKGSEYSYPEGHYCLEQVNYTPGKQGFTDVQRCLKCNGNNEGVSTWGPWTAASHWAIEPIYGYDIYSVTLSGMESISYLIEGYTESSRILNGGFIAVETGTVLNETDIDAGTAPEGMEIHVTINKEEKNIIVEYAISSGIESITPENGSTDMYDTTGRKLKEISVPGIYIVNGRKVLVK